MSLEKEKTLNLFNLVRPLHEAFFDTPKYAEISAGCRYLEMQRVNFGAYFMATVEKIFGKFTNVYVLLWVSFNENIQADL